MIKAVKGNASAREKAVVACFQGAAEEDFREDFGFSPIHKAVLDLHDDSDEDRPGVRELLELVNQLNNVRNHVNEDWSAWKSEYHDRSPLFLEIIDQFQHCKHENDSFWTYQDLLNEPDKINGWSPSYWAAFTGHFAELQVLLSYGPNVKELTPSKRNILHHAAESGNNRMIDHLLYVCRYQESSLDINEPDLWKETPLHIAACNTPGSVSSLLRSGAKLDALQYGGQTPLHYAARAEEQRLSALTDLVAWATPRIINITDTAGRSAIFDFLSSRDCINLLIANGAHIDVKDKQGKTLLHHACREDQPDTLQLLLDKCKKPLLMQRDDKGVTPLDEALESKSAQCAILVLSNHPANALDDRRAGDLLLKAARIGNPTLLELVLKQKLESPYSFVSRAEEARKAAAQEGMNKGRVQELLDELNRQKGHVPRDAEQQKRKER